MTALPSGVDDELVLECVRKTADRFDMEVLEIVKILGLEDHPVFVNLSEFENIPNELFVEYIIPRLTWTDLKNLCLVSTRFADFCKDSHIQSKLKINREGERNVRERMGFGIGDTFFYFKVTAYPQMYDSRYVQNAYCYTCKDVYEKDGVLNVVTDSYRMKMEGRYTPPTESIFFQPELFTDLLKRSKTLKLEKVEDEKLSRFTHKFSDRYQGYSEEPLRNLDTRKLKDKDVTYKIIGRIKTNRHRRITEQYKIVIVNVPTPTLHISTLLKILRDKSISGYISINDDLPGFLSRVKNK